MVRRRAQLLLWAALLFMAARLAYLGVQIRAGDWP